MVYEIPQAVYEMLRRMQLLQSAKFLQLARSSALRDVEHVVETAGFFPTGSCFPRSRSLLRRGSNLRISGVRAVPSSRSRNTWLLWLLTALLGFSRVFGVFVRRVTLPVATPMRLWMHVLFSRWQCPGLWNVLTY